MTSRNRKGAPYFSVPDDKRERPRRMFSLSGEAHKLIEALKEETGVARSRIVDLAVLAPGLREIVEAYALANPRKTRAPEKD